MTTEKTILDFTIESPAERNEIVKKIIAETPSKRMTNRYLEYLTDYIIFAMDKQEKKDKKILTENRMVTVGKRETSFEGLVSKLENGEDGIYSMMNDSKSIIFSNKVNITEKDLNEIPELRTLKAAIEKVEEEFAVATGKRKFKLKRQAIEMRQSQYIIKNAYNKPIYGAKIVKSLSRFDLTEKITINEDKELETTGLINSFNPLHISILLCNYSNLKEENWSNFNGDMHWLLLDLENTIDTSLKVDHPMLFDILVRKIDGDTNVEIQDFLLEKYGVKHSLEYISSLWRNKIPKIIAAANEEKWLEWYFTTQDTNKKNWKKCSRCGQTKLAHNKFFSKNKTSKDGFYSICKKCRNKK